MAVSVPLFHINHVPHLLHCVKAKSLREELQSLKSTTAYRDQEKMARAKTKMQARINELVQVAVVNPGSLLELFCFFERLDTFP